MGVAMRDLRLSVLALAGLALALPASADVFRCVGADGRTLYSDSPCSRDAVQTANITDEVGACSTSACESKRQQTENDARARLRADKADLADMAQKRMERERASFEEQRWQQEMESQIAARANDAALLANPPYYYSAYPVGIAGRPCRGDRCLRPDHRPHRKIPSCPRTGACRSASSAEGKSTRKKARRSGLFCTSRQRTLQRARSLCFSLWILRLW